VFTLSGNTSGTPSLDDWKIDFYDTESYEKAGSYLQTIDLSGIYGLTRSVRNIYWHSGADFIAGSQLYPIFDTIAPEDKVIGNTGQFGMKFEPPSAGSIYGVDACCSIDATAQASGVGYCFLIIGVNPTGLCIGSVGFASVIFNVRNTGSMWNNANWFNIPFNSGLELHTGSTYWVLLGIEGEGSLFWQYTYPPSSPGSTYAVEGSTFNVTGTAIKYWTEGIGMSLDYRMGNTTGSMTNWVNDVTGSVAPNLNYRYLQTRFNFRGTGSVI
jgi:hypothetical protein